MSITALRPSALSAEVEAARASVTAAGAAGFGGVGDDELAAVLVELTGLVHQAESLRVQVLAEAQDREVADRVAASGTDAWAAALTGEKRHLLRGGVWLAERLGSAYPATREAFAAGRLGFDQAMVIVRAAEQAPADATPEQVAQAEELVVAKATGDSTRTGLPMSVARLRRAVRRMFATIDAELADRHEAALLGRQERAAENETWLSLGDNGNGTWSGKFTIPDLHGQLLNEALERLTAPRRLNRDAAGATVLDASAPATGLWEKWGAGFCELLEHLPTAGWSHSASAGVTMLVTIDLERSATTWARPASTAEPGSVPARRGGWRARRGSCRWCSTGSRSRWTWAGRAGCSPPPSARRWRCCTTPVASSPASARTRGASCTTSSPGRTAGPRTSPTRCRCAGITTGGPTTAGSSWADNPAAGGDCTPAGRRSGQGSSPVTNCA
jgi:hypothetical protein